MKLCSPLRHVLCAVATLCLLGPTARAQSSGGGWEIVHDWGQLPEGTEWAATSAIDTTPEGNIAVLRRTAPYIFILSPDGELLDTWADQDGMFRGAHGLTVDRDGFFWITDNADNYVRKYSPDGELLMTLGRPGEAGDNASRDGFDGPADVTVAPNGDIYIADGYRNSRVVRLSASGEFIGIFGGTGGEARGELNLPHAVELDSQGRLIVADAENSRVQVFDAEGRVVEVWSDFSAKPRGGMYILPDDTLYISHVDSESVTVMRNGQVVDTITGLEGRPHGVTVGNDGSVYVANTANQMVKKAVRR